MRDDKNFSLAFQKYVEDMQRTHDEELEVFEEWKDDIRNYFYNLRTSVESCGMDSKFAISLARKDPPPTRERNTFLYLQYRVALAYMNALDTVSIIKEERNPWIVNQVMELLATFDNDAFCHADELVSICEAWWSTTRE